MIITQFGICTVKIEHNDKQKMYKFFVVPGNRQALLGLPDINMMNIMHINCNAMGAQETDRANNCCTNTAIYQDSRHEWNYTNLMQEADKVEECNANRDSISKFDDKDKPVVIDKEPNTINYFIQGPNQDNDTRVSAKITQQLQRDIKGVFAICWNRFLWWNVFIAGKTRQKTIPGAPETWSLCTAKDFQRGARGTPNKKTS